MLQEPWTPLETLNLAEDERWHAIQRIVDSPHFNKSPRLSRLLRFLAEQTLLDGSSLSEHTIAVEAFERDPSFDPAVDTIVRSQMVRLRQKLDRFAQEEGTAASIRVSVPKGEYAVRFDKLPAPASELPPMQSDNESASSTSIQPLSRTLRLLNWTAAFLFLLGSVIFLVRQIHHPADHASAVVHSEHPLWSMMFQQRRPTTFVAADSGLVLLHHMTTNDTTLAEYLTRNFSRETHGLSAQRKTEVLNMAERRYTSFVDMNLFRGLDHLPAASSGLGLKYARDLHMNDLKHSNFIFSGARGSNPWLELYEPGMNFVGSSNETRRSYAFLNRHPATGELPEYSVTEDGPNRRVLGVLAFLANLDGDGNVLIVEGDSMAGTEAISDFVLDDNALLPFLNKVRKRDGQLSHFEVLLESHSVNGSAGPFRILAYRTHP